MSLHAPFLVKQYLSDDVENGSYSRIFWYYPLEKERTGQGGIGLFFEVLSGDVDDQVYEQITKRFWESFADSFYTEGFEPALKKSIKTFIQLLRNFKVEEGLDVNIVLMNVVVAEKGYTLKLIGFGDSDVFVVREGKFADMGKMIPNNASLYDLKFLEVELDKGDVLMLGNKTLLRNAFEADMFALSDIDSLLRSLENFKENLFGSKKLFLVAATDSPEPEKVVKKSAMVEKATAFAGNLFGKLKRQAEDLFQKIKKKPGDTDESILPTGEKTVASEAEDMAEAVVEMPEQTEVAEVVTAADEPEIIEAKSKFIAPPPVDETDEDEIVPELSDISEKKATVDEHIIEPPTSLPGRAVTVDDFVVAEEITPAMVVEKSTYQGFVEDAANDEIQDPSPEDPSYQPVKPIQATAKADSYINELRLRHSLFGKALNNPMVKKMGAAVQGGFQFVVAKVLGLFGKAPVELSKEKYFLSRPASIQQKKIQPGVIIIIVIAVLAIILKVNAASKQAKVEKTLITEYQQTVAAFSDFFEKNIATIDTEDTERQLELCSPEAEKVYVKEKLVAPKILTTKNKEAVATLTSQVKAKESECQSKFDRIYGILRIKDAELVADFKVSLGNDSDISVISFQKTAIVVADKGRKAVYQLNVDTKAITKLEDPLGLVVDPITVGTGEGTLFVCDKTNGVLSYSKNATGGKEGFTRIVGAEPSAIGECALVEGYGPNAYVVPNTANAIYKIVGKTTSSFSAPTRYIKDLLGVKSLSIDGYVYVVSSVDGKGDVTRFYGGKLDNFSIPQSANLGDLSVSYTNPSSERNLYVFDKTRNAILSIEKPNSKHAGRGIVEKTYLLENADKFKDVRSIAVDLNVNNQEVYMYVLAGTTIWRFRL